MDSTGSVIRFYARLGLIQAHDVPKSVKIKKGGTRKDTYGSDFDTSTIWIPANDV